MTEPRRPFPGDGMEPPGARPAGPADLEHVIGRLLLAGTLAAIVLIAIGVALMLGSGISPLDRAPRLRLDAIVADVLALRPAGFLWLGVIVTMATPAARVVAALLGYARNEERQMALVALLILVVIAIGVVLGTAAA